jgi:hypothetical protein
MSAKLQPAIRRCAPKEWRLCRARHKRHHADNRIMPTAFSSLQRGGGDRAFPNRLIGIIRGVRETRAVDPVDDTGLASHRAGSCVPALAP